jgi:hypothetical protein
LHTKVFLQRVLFQQAPSPAESFVINWLQASFAAHKFFSSVHGGSAKQVFYENFKPSKILEGARSV